MGLEGTVGSTPPGDLCDPVANYGGRLGKWWFARAENPSHLYAYRQIANFIRASLRGSPALIVDYACGAGHLLTRLSIRFPRSRLMGLDRSALLLERARRRMSRLGDPAVRRIALFQVLLPDFVSRRPGADIAVYSFPNMLPPFGKSGSIWYRRYLGPADVRTAAVLARSSDSDEGHRVEDPERVQADLLLGRLISLNLRGLLKRGGTCFRVEYAKARRHELRRIDLMRVAFEEGSLDMEVNGSISDQWFRVLASSYFRSRVMEDVYQQTHDEQDSGGGGYVITVLRAL
ncbi:MAG TPA: class I SAM-dependent methyltransferase [Acidobacteriota bacterium]|nr:class I SAM-dependent methyltransferase [Acidobacteriota bacterium]